MSSNTVKAHCNKCLQETNHKVLGSVSTDFADIEFGNGDDSESFLEAIDTYQMLQCCGCDKNVTMRRLRSFSNYSHDEKVIYYPPAVLRKEPEWSSYLKNIFVREMLKEVYVALHNDSRRLATMGIRAILENVMIDNVGDNRTFENNLAKFEEEKFISSKQKEILEPVLEAGHAAMHRTYNPSHNELIAVLGIIESIIELVYVHSDTATWLNEKIPKRASSK